MSQSRREKSCPPLFSLMPCCQLAVRSRQELGAMLINISAPDTFNQQPQLGQCICKKVNEYLFWFPSNLVFGRDHCLRRWQSTMHLLKWSKLIGAADREDKGLPCTSPLLTRTKSIFTIMNEWINQSIHKLFFFFTDKQLNVPCHGFSLSFSSKSGTTSCKNSFNCKLFPMFLALFVELQHGMWAF